MGITQRAESPQTPTATSQQHSAVAGRAGWPEAEVTECASNGPTEVKLSLPEEATESKERLDKPFGTENAAVPNPVLLED